MAGRSAQSFQTVESVTSVMLMQSKTIFLNEPKGSQNREELNSNGVDPAL